ncbi:MAG: hypothetical protein K2M64_00595, partial [Clostridia bacterium]|nr:hypothetical protein [Clostridia bacterium]
MLFRILLSNTGFMIGVVVEGVITLVSLILIILVAKFGLPNFEAKERKPKKAKAPKAEKEKYVLKYVAGEGSGESPALEQYAKGAKVVLKSNMFATPTGKIFDGWSDGEKTYFPSQKYVMPAQPVTFTAQWGIPEAKYPLRYVAGEGSGEEPTVENYA